MIPVAIFAFLVAAVLGMRWGVLVLIPTCAVIAASFTTFELLTHQTGLMTVASRLAAILLAHQIGYLFGALIRGYFAYGARQRADLVTRTRF
jgi:hypothetical protein